MSKRRDFLKYLGTGSLGMVFPLGALASPPEPPAERSETVSVGANVRIELLYRDELFQGIGNVSISGRTVRDGKLPMFIDIRNPDGISITNYRVYSAEVNKDQVKLVFKAYYTPGGPMEWMLHTVRNRQNLPDLTAGVQEASDLSIELVITPVTRTIGNHAASGFQYQYRYKSESVPIYKILDRSSWEIDGSCMDNHFWMRHGIAPPLTQFKTADQFYSTEWYLPGIANPNIFQFHPLQTHLQGFSFTSSDAGSLVTWASNVSHVRSLFEKRRGHNRLLHFHEHCNDLALNFETSPMEVLWCEGKMDFSARANLYYHVSEMVHEQLHTQIGMNRDRVTTYGIIEEWTEPDFQHYQKNGLPKLLDAGVRTVFIPNQCQNAMNVWGLSNMCCTVDLKISDVTGEDKLKGFCEEVRRRGAQVQMWGNTALSTLTELFSHTDGSEKGIKFLPYKDSVMEVIDHAESPWVRNPSNAIEADHYTPRFAVMNLRDASIRAYWMKQWKYFHDHIGIDGIFLDSSFNMSSDKFHFRQSPEGNGWHGATLDSNDIAGKFRPSAEPGKIIHTQYHAHLEWMVQMQGMGYHYSGEDLGVFGIHRTGPSATERATALFLWENSYADFDHDALLKAGFEPYSVFFRGLAYRVVWKLQWKIKEDELSLGTSDPRAFHLLKVFNEASPYMYHREILSDEKGVVYSSNGHTVIWCFEVLDYPLEKKRAVRNLITGKTERSANVRGQQFQVYLVS